jgi:hypothetical protein
MVSELKNDMDNYSDNELDDDNTPECFGTGSYACGSEQCDWCEFEQECGGIK